MPRRLRIVNHLSVEELEHRYRTCQEVREREHWLVIWLLRLWTPSEYVANRTGLSVKWIRQLAQRYNQEGPEALRDKRRQHPGPALLLDETQMDELRAALELPVPSELGGGLWNGPKVAAWMRQTLDRPIHKRRGSEYLHRAGYSSQSPRPRHTQGDKSAQDAFKKVCS